MKKAIGQAKKPQQRINERKRNRPNNDRETEAQGQVAPSRGGDAARRDHHDPVCHHHHQGGLPGSRQAGPRRILLHGRLLPDRDGGQRSRHLPLHHHRRSDKSDGTGTDRQGAERHRGRPPEGDRHGLRLRGRGRGHGGQQRHRGGGGAIQEHRLCEETAGLEGRQRRLHQGHEVFLRRLCRYHGGHGQHATPALRQYEAEIPPGGALQRETIPLLHRPTLQPLCGPRPRERAHRRHQHQLLAHGLPGAAARGSEVSSRAHRGTDRPLRVGL